jgi:uncharacterized integral membrane protein
MMYVNNLKALCIQHWERRTYILKKNFKRLNKCTKKKNNAPNCVERFKVPTVLMVMSCSVTFCWFALHETLILLLFCVFIEMVKFNYLKTIILKPFLIIVFTSILHLFYRIIIRFLGPITSDVMNTVTLSTWQYTPNTRN